MAYDNGNASSISGKSVTNSPADGQVLKYNSATNDVTWQTDAAGSGTVTSVSVVSANGLAGTVATATTTPAITLSTSVTGILKGNGTAISAGTAGDVDSILPTQTGNTGKYLTTDGTNSSWAAVAGGGGASVFDAEVNGAGTADYTTVGAAIAAGKYRLLISGDTTETGDIALGANNVYMYIEAGATVTIPNYQFTTTGYVEVCGSGEIDWTPTVAKTLFSGTTASVKIYGITIDNNATVNNCRIADGINMISGINLYLPNAISGGIYHNVTGGSYFKDSNVIGGGSSCYNAIIQGSSIFDAFINNITFSGTFNTTSVILTTYSTTNNLNFTSPQKHIVNTRCNASGWYCTASGYLEWNSSQIASNVPSVVSNSFIGGAGASLTFGANFLSAIGINSLLGGVLDLNTRSRCRVANCFFGGGYTISTGDNNILSGNTAGSSGTITISDAGAVGNIIIGNQTGIAISDSGTGTVLANNYEY